MKPEITKEQVEKVREYYSDMTAEIDVHAAGVADGIEETLNILGIEIEGVNA
ncbi:hypothetical protein [Bacillus altitudinis]|uniref:hypothetical protein n=1 Tax=Bacillus altitudinis TaxID=293387 RepID=UPI0012FDDB19|nr:hypothetical protein [Bacillus altitudinis]